MFPSNPFFYCLFLGAIFLNQSANAETTLTGSIVDGETGELISARLYIESEKGEFFLAKSASPQGDAATYEKRRSKTSLEVHTSLSAHPFEASLAPGKYKITAERGHEYLSADLEVEIKDGQNAPIELKLKRWINMNARGWFSGETHCHRNLNEMGRLMEAEDLNVTFPITAWVTDTTQSPANPEDNKVKQAETGLRAIGIASSVGENRVIWPLNTEYEIFTVGGKKHTLGAFFILNHKYPIEETVPPIGPLFERVTENGALIEMDKHNWPWTLMLPTLLKENGLFELSNNHVWRTRFAITDWYPEMIGDYMAIPTPDNGGAYDEAGWLDFGFKTYYALLNCGFKLSPTAGTGSGYHPVPLGFSRVYVRPAEGEFSYENWIEGLSQGHCFVTNGPMISVSVAECRPGTKIDADAANKLDLDAIDVVGWIESAHPIERLEIIINGIASPVEVGGSIGAKAPHSAFVREKIKLEGESWVAFRAFSRTSEGRIRFAHSAPVWIDAKGKSLLPTVLESKYLRDRMRTEIERNKEVIPEDALKEFEEAEEFYNDLLNKAVKASR